MSSARILLFTGKGGVGTTTIAAATALRIGDAAEGDRRALLVSINSTRALGDLFHGTPGAGPAAIAPGVWTTDLGTVGPGGASDEERGMRVVDELARSGDWDTLVVDGPGATPPPDLEGLSVRLVVTAERLAVAEARRTATRLAIHGHTIDEVVANRILPHEGTGPWLDEWRQNQSAHLADIEAGFAGVPVRRARQASVEMTGIDAVRSLGAELYGDDDPRATCRGVPSLRIVRTEGGYRLTLSMPFASRETIELGRRGDELLLTVDGHHRLLLLPDSLRRRSVSDARFGDGCLVVDFVDPA